MIKRYFLIFLKSIKNIHQMKDFVHRAFTENLTFKLTAALVTLTIFILIAGESVQISKTAKIEYITAENMMVVNTVPFEFEMILSGPKSAIGMLRTRNFSYKVDLSHAGPGFSRIRINPRQLGLDRGIVATSVMPSILYPKIDKVITKIVPIILSEKGNARYFSIRSIVLEPDQISITGPESFINQIFYIFTEPFDLEKVTKNGRYEIKLTLPNDKISLTKSSDELIKVKVDAVPFRRENK